MAQAQAHAGSCQTPGLLATQSVNNNTSYIAAGCRACLIELKADMQPLLCSECQAETHPLVCPSGAHSEAALASVLLTSSRSFSTVSICCARAAALYRAEAYLPSVPCTVMGICRHSGR